MEDKYLDMAKKELAVHGLTLEDLTDKELATLLEEMEDKATHPENLFFDGFLEFKSLNLWLRKGIKEKGEPIPDHLKDLS